MRVKSTQCTDQYWLKIRQLGRGTNVILEQYETSWLPCIPHLRENMVNAYATVNGRKGQLSDMESYFDAEAENLSSSYENNINGIYIRNPSQKGSSMTGTQTCFQI